ncbi:uncharacterized protein METZ01_LOCUS405565 [marine metagenome]|uniref:Uncharacterized protein n=1 Tax=marine metagenome TaxID=408172 RepID=A0A382W3K0_9ZZZZ
MKIDGEILSVIVAIGLCPIVPIFHIILIRLLKKEEIILPTFFASFFYVSLWGFLVFRELSVYSLSIIAITRMLVAGICTIGFLVFTYMEAISQVFRGFTMNTLINVHYNQPMSFQEVIGKSGSETETNWFVTNRIQIMEDLNLVQCKDKALTLLPKGVFAGKMGIIVKKVLNMGVGG